MNPVVPTTSLRVGHIVNVQAILDMLLIFQTGSLATPYPLCRV